MTWAIIVAGFILFSVFMYAVVAHGTDAPTPEDQALDDEEQTNWIEENTKTNLNLDDSEK